MVKAEKKVVEKKPTEKKPKALQYYEAVGRRKTAVARVRLYISPTGTLKKGDMVVNSKPAFEYFPSVGEKNRFLEPLKLAESLDRFIVSIKILGGGKNGQLEAAILGLARALQKVDMGYRQILKENDLLTRDGRVRERRKVGTGGRARRKKQ